MREQLDLRRIVRKLPVQTASVVYLQQGRRYVFARVCFCLSVCLSVSKITKKRVHEFG